MRKALIGILAATMLIALLAPGVSAAVPTALPESGATIFAGGGTALSNGYFFPGTALPNGKEWQGLPPVQLARGTDLTFINLDPAAVTNGHQIVSFKRKHRTPVFISKRVDGPGQALIVTSHLKPGVYPYFCATHYGMYGRIEVTP